MKYTHPPHTHTQANINRDKFRIITTRWSMLVIIKKELRSRQYEKKNFWFMFNLKFSNITEDTKTTTFMDCRSRIFDTQERQHHFSRQKHHSSERECSRRSVPMLARHERCIGDVVSTDCTGVLSDWHLPQQLQLHWPGHIHVQVQQYTHLSTGGVTAQQVQ